MDTLSSVPRSWIARQTPTSSYVYRAALLDSIWEALASHTLVALVAPSGYGKTSLCQDTMRIWASHFRSHRPVVSVDLTSRESLAVIRSFSDNDALQHRPPGSFPHPSARIAHHSRAFTHRRATTSSPTSFAAEFHLVPTSARPDVVLCAGDHSDIKQSQLAATVREPISRLVWTYIDEQCPQWVSLCSLHSASLSSVFSCAPLVVIENLPPFSDEEDEETFASCVDTWRTLGVAVILTASYPLAVPDSLFGARRLIGARDLMLSNTEVSEWARRLCLANDDELPAKTRGIPALVDAYRTSLPGQSRSRALASAASRFVAEALEQPLPFSAVRLMAYMVLIGRGTTADLVAAGADVKTDDLALLEECFPFLGVSCAEGVFSCPDLDATAFASAFARLKGAAGNTVSCAAFLIDTGRAQRALALARLLSPQDLCDLVASRPYFFLEAGVFDLIHQAASFVGKRDGHRAERTSANRESVGGAPDDRLAVIERAERIAALFEDSSAATRLSLREKRRTSEGQPVDQPQYDHRQIDQQQIDHRHYDQQQASTLVHQLDVTAWIASELALPLAGSLQYGPTGPSGHDAHAPNALLPAGLLQASAQLEASALAADVESCILAANELLAITPGLSALDCGLIRHYVFKCQMLAGATEHARSWLVPIDETRRAEVQSSCAAGSFQDPSAAALDPPVGTSTFACTTMCDALLEMDSALLDALGAIRTPHTASAQQVRERLAAAQVYLRRRGADALEGELSLAQALVRMMQGDEAGARLHSANAKERFVASGDQLGQLIGAVMSFQSLMAVGETRRAEALLPAIRRMCRAWGIARTRGLEAALEALADCAAGRQVFSERPNEPGAPPETTTAWTLANAVAQGETRAAGDVAGQLIADADDVQVARIVLACRAMGPACQALLEEMDPVCASTIAAAPMEALAADPGTSLWTGTSLEGAAALSSRTHTATEPLQVRLFGHVSIVLNGHELYSRNWGRSGARDLVLLLAAVSGHRLDAERVMQALWPGQDAGLRRNSLSAVICVVRKMLGQHNGGPAYIGRVGNDVVLDVSLLKTDIDEFRARCQALSQDGEADPDWALRSATVLSRAWESGVGVDVALDRSEGPWADVLQELRVAYREAMVDAAHLASRANRQLAAVAFLRRAIEAAPKGEELEWVQVAALEGLQRAATAQAANASFPASTRVGEQTGFASCLPASGQ